MTAPDPPTVHIWRLVPATPGEVYAAWTDPTLMSQWMSPLGHAEVAAEAHVGGRLRVVMVDAEMTIEHHGEFIELDPPHLVRFTWISPYTGSAPSIVTVTFTAQSGQTRLDLVHELLPADVAAAHAGGWGAMVDRMVAVLDATAGQEVRQ